MPKFENPKSFFASRDAQMWAKTIANNFSYPVDSIILSSNGKLIQQKDVATFFSDTKGDVYLKMLTKITKK